jgi:NAD(P)-dependent dehydrogenase (short-subunit alcohol dehydrogenase family)
VASGDRNPLHLSEQYARCTPYGQPIVFGCLAAIACLGHCWRPGWYASSIEAEFLRPVFLGVRYRVENSEKEGTQTVWLFDGSTPVVSVTVTLEPFRVEELPEVMGPPPFFEHREASVRKPETIIPGLKVSGFYACDASSLNGLATRWGVTDALLTTALCWSSYLVGMELPGESALFSKLVLHLHGRGQRLAPMQYRASVASVDPRIGQIKIDVCLLAGDSPIASGQCSSYVRPPVPEVEDVDSTGVRADSLAGRAVVLLGSSRGLGAAMKRALELRGAVVYGLARSEAKVGLPRTMVGDAADPEALRRMRELVSAEQGRLDFLVCNAFPPILPLRLEPDSAARIGAYINLAVSLTLLPLSEFLELLNRNDGCVVIISSAAVEHPVREWPHYVAAKRAVEMLGAVAALQYPRVRTLIVRPEKLLTTLTNKPLGRSRAASPQRLANRIAARLEDPLTAGKTEILD